METAPISAAMDALLASAATPTAPLPRLTGAAAATTTSSRVTAPGGVAPSQVEVEEGAAVSDLPR